jgi:hypothetical protein
MEVFILRCDSMGRREWNEAWEVMCMCLMCVLRADLHLR